MLLTVIPAAKGLLQKIIPQSGHVDFYNEPEIYAQVTEKFIAFSGTKNMRDKMKKSAVKLQQLYAKYLTVSDGSNLADFYPTADEWRAFLLGDENFFKNIPRCAKKNSPVIRRYKAQTPEEVYKAWLNGRPDTEDNFADFMMQLDWRVGQELAAEYQSAFDDVYFYLFSEPSTIEALGSCHAIDLCRIPSTCRSTNLLRIKILCGLFKRRGRPSRRRVISTTNSFRTGKNIPSTIVKTWS